VQERKATGGHCPSRNGTGVACRPSKPMGYSIVTQKAIVERPRLGSGNREVERLEAGVRVTPHKATRTPEMRETAQK